MRTLHIISNLDTGGAETALCNLLSGLEKDRFQPSVVSLVGLGEVGRRIERLGIPVHVLNLTTGTNMPQALTRLIKIVREYRPNLVQGWMYHGNFAASIAGLVAGRNVPVLWNIRHTPTELENEKRLTSLLIRFGARLSRRTSGIIYNARRSADCHEGLGYDSSSRTVIPNGIDLVKFRPSTSDRAWARSELGISDNTPLVGMVGNYRPIKDHTTFLDAAAIQIRRMPDVHFLLIGAHVVEGNRILSGQIRERGLEGHTHLLGLRQDVPRWMAALDVATSSSRSEGFANVIGEAMACGVPCVVTDVGDSAWIAGDCGRVVPPREPAALADGWHDLLTMRPEDRKALRLQARERIIEYFSMPAMLQAYATLHGGVERNDPAIN